MIIKHLLFNDLEAWEKELAKGDVCACIIDDEFSDAQGKGTQRECK